MGKNTQDAAEVPNNYFDANGKSASAFTIANLKTPDNKKKL